MDVRDCIRTCQIQQQLTEDTTIQKMGIQIKIPAHEHTLHIMHPSPEANQWLRDANMKMSGGEPSTGKRFIPPDRRRQQSEELEELMAIQEAELREVESTLRDINK